MKRVSEQINKITIHIMKIKLQNETLQSAKLKAGARGRGYVQ